MRRADGGGKTASAAWRYSFVTKRVTRKVSLFRRSEPRAGVQPPCTPKEVENLKIHHQNHDRTVLVTNFQIFL